MLAFFELRHSGEANELRREANNHRADANRLQDRVAELEQEKATHLAKIATNTQRPISEAERNSKIMAKYVGKIAQISEEGKSWPGGVEIADLSGDVVSLFMPYGGYNSEAGCVKVHCKDLEIAEMPYGQCAVRLKILRRYGPEIRLGQITRWEDRDKPVATPQFEKGNVVYQAGYTKPGSPEKRTLTIIESKNGSNEYMLETSAGEAVIGNNVETAKRFYGFEVDYGVDGFRKTSGGANVSKNPLFMRS